MLLSLFIVIKLNNMKLEKFIKYVRIVDKRTGETKEINLSPAQRNFLKQLSKLKSKAKVAFIKHR